MTCRTLGKEQELGELKSRVITSISHEFRTPLTTIMGSSELLKHYGQNWSEEKKLKHFQRIEYAVNQLTKLLDNIVFIGETEVGELEFHPTKLDIEEITHEIIEELKHSWERPLGGNTKIVPTIMFSSQIDESKAQLDGKLIRQVLTHLISNAVKYSPPGKNVSLNLVSQNGQAIFQIQDEGIGIPPKERERVFETFYRASNVNTTQGTGLGLAIVKKCVDSLGGQISLESEVGVGTTVTVILPLNPRPTPEINLK